MPRDFLQPSAEPLLLYPFRFRDSVSGKWVRARYMAERTEIATRYAEWEAVRTAQNSCADRAGFNPWRPVS